MIIKPRFIGFIAIYNIMAKQANNDTLKGKHYFQAYKLPSTDLMWKCCFLSLQSARGRAAPVTHPQPPLQSTRS